MESLRVERMVLNWPIFVDVIATGANYLVRIGGGCAPHIGSVSVGTFENDEVHLQKILLPTHRDDVVGDRFAEVLAKRLQTTVTVVCGIHYENPGKEGLRRIVDCTEELLREVQMRLAGAPGE